MNASKEDKVKSVRRQEFVKDENQNMARNNNKPNGNSKTMYSSAIGALKLLKQDNKEKKRENSRFIIEEKKSWICIQEQKLQI